MHAPAPETILKPANLVELLRWRATHQAEQMAYRFLLDSESQHLSLTYRELDQQARLIGACLQAQLAVGDRVLLLYPPGLDYIAAFWGCLYAGVVAVSAYPPKRNRNLHRLQAIMADAAAAAALTTSAIRSRIPPGFSDFGSARWFVHEELIQSGNDEWQPGIITGDTLAFLQYTSGSTSTPKGVMLTHRNLLHNEEAITKAFGQTKQSVIVGWLPLYHDMGLIGNVIQPLFVGAPCILMSPVSFLQRPSRWLWAISDYKATTSGGPNFAYELCARKITPEECEGLDLSSWRVAFNGAEPIRAETLEKFAATFEPYGFNRDAFYPCYGLAESTLLVASRFAERPAVVKGFQSKALEEGRASEVNEAGDAVRLIVGCGKTIPGQEIVVADPESMRRSTGEEIGEIWVGGPSVAAGYWNQPEETERTFRAYLADTAEGPFLRTGDLGFLRDGELFITGRVKDLIIIRGRNHYPQDIELTVEQSHPALRPGCGAAFSIEMAGEERLVIVQEVDHHQSNLEEINQTIIETVSDNHEVQAHAVALIRPGTIPKTSSGKIRRRACREALVNGELDLLFEWRAKIQTALPASSSGPLTFDADGISDWLRQRLAERLAMTAEQVDVNHSIVSYGVDSLLAVELAHDIETHLGVVLPLADFLRSPSISQLTQTVLELLHSDASRSETALIPATKHEDYALSRGQQALWFLYQLAPESAAYNNAGAVRIKSRLDVAALQRVFQKLVTRHEALRVAFRSIDGQPMQRVQEQTGDYFQVIDASAWDDGVLMEHLGEESHRPFDLESGPLLRVSLFRISEEEHILLLVLHHIVSDLWSLAVLIHEIGILYPSELVAEPVQLPALDLQYSDYVRWQEDMLRSDKGERHWSYWQKQLAGELPSLNLPLDHPRKPLQSYEGASESFTLDAELTKRLKSLGQENESTLYMTLLAAFQVLLHRYTNQAELIVGAPTLGRSRKEFGGLVGYFVNPLPLRLTLPANHTFESLLGEVRRVVLEALEHQDFPFATLVERLRPERDPSRSPLFQVAFVFQKTPFPEGEMLSAFATDAAGLRIKLGGLELESVALEQRIAQFDLTLMVAENDGALTGSFEYNTDLFEAATIKRLAQHFEVLLRSIAAGASRNIFALPLLTAAEQHQLLTEWNDTAAAYPPGQCMHDLFEDQVRRTPDAPAVTIGETTISYAGLNAKANQLGHYLRALGIGPEMRVAVLMNRSIELVAGLLGILKAGGVYVPLDAQYPHDRLRYLLADAQAQLVLTERRWADLLSGVTTPLVQVDERLEEIARQSVENPRRNVEAQNLAYIIYTSGSTGNPKGVAIQHESATTMLHWAHDVFSAQQLAGVLASTSICFDLSVFELFAPLSCGGKVILADNALQLPYLPAAEEVTLINTVPSAMTELNRIGGVPSSVITVNLAGEALKNALVQEVYERENISAVFNLYGPSEDTTYSTYARMRKGSDESPAIGRPVANTQAYIVDDNMQLVPAGVSGELYLGGEGLARGYLNRPELTAEKFVPNPFSTVPGARLYRTGDLVRYLPNSELDYLGRLDHQIKLRGFRIELGEIETILMQHENVREAVVMVRSHEADTGKQLVAYVVAKNKPEPSVNELRRYLQTKLPSFMLPAVFVMLDEMPLTPNGKVDRRALPAPDGHRPELERNYVPPRLPVEEKLADIWKVVLGVERVGVNDNFFELGGDSILSLQVVAKARQSGLLVSPQDLLQHQTIAELSALAVAHNAESQPVADDLVTGPVPLTPIQHWFFEEQTIDPHHFNQSVTLRVRQALDLDLLQQAFVHLITHHDALRLRFEVDGNTWRQINARHEPHQVVSCIDVSQLENGVQEIVFKSERSLAHAALNLSEGPLIKVILFDAGPAKQSRLLVIIHHLVVDAVSWRILLEDLDRAYSLLSAGEAVTLERKTNSFKQWAEQLQQYAKSGRAEQELDYWLDHRRRRVSSLPVDKSRGRNDVNSSRAITVKLDRAATRALRLQVPSVYHTQINEVLLTALLQAYEQWCGSDRLLIDLEGHGREEELVDLSLARTVGWFTAIFPLLLELSETTSTGETVQQVKEQVRRVPQKGIGYGVLRYLCNSQVSAELQALPQAEMSFNYLGQLDGNLAVSEWFAVLHEENETSRSANALRRYLIEIDGWISDDQLSFRFTYSKNLHRRATIQRLAEAFRTSLRELIAHCESLPGESFSPSDFPLAKLDQRKFNQLTALLNKEV
ncbi:MAG TPA: amino acid adenylation domain-containing protein [Pyrinomonadaceae bacterium]|nr:amino acid adenylation domain-containing protein [Pyrinomonadaceae bacterium]